MTKRRKVQPRTSTRPTSAGRRSVRHKGGRQFPFPHEHVAMVGYSGGRYDHDNDGDTDTPGVADSDGPGA